MEDRKTAIITGASSGIGEAFARRFASDGYDLVLISRSANKLGERARHIEGTYGTSASVLPADLATNRGVRLVEQYISTLDKINCLINNAGFGARGDFLDAESSSLDQMEYLHMTSPRRLVSAALPSMSDGDAIINVSSLASLIARSSGIVYGATKAYLNHFSKGLAKKVSDRGIKVQALCPGYTMTNFHNSKEYGKGRPRTPRCLWMDPDKVVDLSLKNLGKGVVYVPGALNKLLLAGMRSPLSDLLLRLKK